MQISMPLKHKLEHVKAKGKQILEMEWKRVILYVFFNIIEA